MELESIKINACPIINVLNSGIGYRRSKFYKEVAEVLPKLNFRIEIFWFYTIFLLLNTIPNTSSAFFFNEVRECIKNPSICTDEQLCSKDVLGIHGELAFSYPRHLTEAKKRQLACVPVQPKKNKVVSHIRTEFLKLDVSDRRLIQKKLKDLSMYGSEIDGLWGPGTKAALNAFNSEKYNKINLTKDGSERILRALIDYPSTVGMHCLPNDLSSCTPDEICEKATTRTGDTKRWNLANPEMVNYAKSSQIDCKVELIKKNGPAVKEASKAMELNLDEPVVQPLQVTETMMQERFLLGDYPSALLAANTLVSQNNASAQLILGRMYSEGLGVLQQYKVGYMWLNISALNGSNEAIQRRNNLELKMSRAAVVEAQELAVLCLRNGYKTCGEKTGIIDADMKTTKQKLKEIVENFRSSSLTRRKHIQYSLQELGLYNSGVDGRWGPATERAVSNYLNLSGLNYTSADDTITTLISKVELPSYFANTNKKVATSRSSKKQTLTAPPGWRNFGNATVPFEQAETICRSQSNNVTAQSVFGPGTTTNCIGGGFGVTCNSSPSMDLGTTLGLLINKKNRQANYYTSCMAQYGWAR